MNKYREALERLRILEKAKNLHYQNQVAPQVDCDVLQELVDKATPKKPMQKAAGRKVCPNCERSTVREVSPRYCSICGQAIDWSDNETT